MARGLFESRARAQAAISAGLVTVNGATARKSSESFEDDARIEAEQPWPWVSRGGVKLAHALDQFGIPVDGRICLDVGSSTGGFSHVLLDRGARYVIAVDSGRDQMHASLREEPRLSLHEETDIRHLTWPANEELASLVVIDVSFISLTLVIPTLEPFVRDGADMVALIKPQFEVGRAKIGKNGVVTDSAAREDAIASVKLTSEDSGWRVAGVIDSPIAGGDGNREYLMHARRAAAPK